MMTNSIKCEREKAILQFCIDGPPGSPGSGGKRRFVSEYGGGWKVDKDVGSIRSVDHRGHEPFLF
jgi:hypothetical protein